MRDEVSRMLTVISPAKKMNEDGYAAVDALDPTVPMFEKEATAIAKIARRLSVEDLCHLMRISPALGVLNQQRFAALGRTATAHTAAFLFDGDTYSGLEARRMERDTLHWAQNNLRILSGLYGLLRPMDQINPYRLEMGSRLANPKGQDLYAFWGHKLAHCLNELAQEQRARALVNCASVEYFSAISMKALKLPIINPVFLESKDGQTKIISFWAKKARGALAKFICENHLTEPNDIKAFCAGGYAFDAQSSDEHRFVYVRPAPESVDA
jgi:cytoplasmic iron level regulating protein YaaA (DUF328/UPF0246 family)